MKTEATALFKLTDGAEGWEDDLAAQALNSGAIVLRLPNERGVDLPPGVIDGALLLSITAAARRIVRLVLFLVDRFHTGVMIDCRPETPVVTRNNELRRGEILLVDDEGARLLRTDDKGALAEPGVAAIVRKLTRSGRK